MQEISSFSGEYHFLSNMYVCPVPYNGRIWASSEHAYQASKTLDLAEQEEIFLLSHPKQTKKKGQFLTLRDDWTADTKTQIMEDIVRAKFVHNLDIQQKLIDTYPAVLTEGNYWNDNFWGKSPADNKNGRNHLGKILMKVRQELMLAESVDF